MSSTIGPGGVRPFSAGDVVVDGSEDADGTEKSKETKKAKGPEMPSDIVVTAPLQMLNADGTAVGPRPGDGNEPLSIDAAGGPGKADPSTAQGLLLDMASGYDQMSQHLNMMFQRVMQDARGRKEELEHQIGEIENRIKVCRETIDKLTHLLEKITQLMPKIMEMVGAENKENAEQMKARLEALIADELKKAGIDMPKEQVKNIVDGIASGDNAATGLAIYMVLTIAQAGAGTAADKQDAANRLSGVADRAEKYAEASDDDRAAASQALIDSLVPPGTPATAAGADAAKNGVAVEGVSISSDTMKTAMAMNDPKQAAAYVMDQVTKQIEAKVDKLEADIEQMRAEQRALRHEMQEIDKDVEKNQRETQQAVDKNSKQKEKVLDRVTTILENEVRVSDEAKQFFCDRISAQLSVLAQSIADNAAKEGRNARS
ncbi:MAG: hypothetical protein IT381_12805 [Deltaproteobacteria bacterium]|nr:hypothetical protein [Deltaproteobacteria bacterium]